MTPHNPETPMTNAAQSAADYQAARAVHAGQDPTAILGLTRDEVWVEGYVAALETTRDTATPPADTRQQASEKGPLYDDLKQRMETLHVRWARHAARQTKTARETGYWDAVEACRIELRDVLACYPASSPALPEPPAPTGRDSAGAYWNVAHGGKVDVLLLPEDDAHRVFVELSDSKSNRAYTPYEARQLASTLLAAADVAEEQQP